MEPPRCFITMDFMPNPVTDCNGHTFEKSAIESWYREHDTSPVTNQRVAHKHLIPNFAVKQLTEEYIKAQTNPMSAVNIPIKKIIDPTPIKPFTQPPITINQQYLITASKEYMSLEIGFDTTPDTRKPVTCICVIDISGSMGERATEYNPSGENDGFSRLDLVKHSLTTIFKSLQPNDKIALITFNQFANTLLEPTNISNTAVITTAINGLSPGGNTNLWAGLKSGIDIANTITDDSNIAIMILTDGVSNYNPPRGLIPTFDAYKQVTKFTIHTFAYGYEIDSESLAYLATKGNGIFGYIPDGTMVGTIFINAISNILATGANGCTLNIIANANLTLLGTISPASTKPSNNINIDLGSLLYGQTRTLVFEVTNKLEPQIQGFIDFNYDSKHLEIPIKLSLASTPQTIVNNIARCNIVSIISQLIADNNITHKDLITLFPSKYSTDTITPYITDLITDCVDKDANKGQLGKSVEKGSWYSKWGRHYLRSVIRAHQLQQCLNFKDLAPQHYNGAKFTEYQEQIEIVFNNIAPPQPSIATPSFSTGRYTSYNGGQAAAASPSYASIPTSYYNVSGGCFTGNWLVNMANGTVKPVKAIQPNDVVVSKNSPTGTATIKCVVKLRINSDIPMSCPDGINGITNYHPIYTDSQPDQWIFPVDYTTATYGSERGQYMYDFVLDQGHTVSMQGGFNIACLGHGITSSPVIAHEYFGTNRIIDDLKDHDDWSTGYITMDNWCFKRNAITNRIERLEF
jgi:hypothetical protein